MSAIIGSDVIGRIISMMPSEVWETSFSLNSQQPLQASYTSYTWNYARKFNNVVDESELLLAGALSGDEWRTFELFKTTETVNPKIGDTVTDENGAIWQVKKVDKRMFDLIFKCLCLKNK